MSDTNNSDGQTATHEDYEAAVSQAIGPVRSGETVLLVAGLALAFWLVTRKKS